MDMTPTPTGGPTPTPDETRITFDSLLRDSFRELSEGFRAIAAEDIAVTLLVALGVSLFIFLVYRLTFRGVQYSTSFNVSLVLMTLITSFVILTISSNVVLSLGMVGALSIVRFRTAVKDPMDIVFMFWAIGAGITAGAGVYSVALVSSAAIGLVLLAFSRVRLVSSEYVLVVRYDAAAEERVRDALAHLRARLKSTSVSGGQVEMTLDVRVRGDDTTFVSALAGLEGVRDAVLVRFRGDYES